EDVRQRRWQHDAHKQFARRRAEHQGGADQVLRRLLSADRATHCNRKERTHGDEEDGRPLAYAENEGRERKPSGHWNWPQSLHDGIEHVADQLEPADQHANANADSGSDRKADQHAPAAEIYVIQPSAGVPRELRPRPKDPLPPRRNHTDGGRHEARIKKTGRRRVLPSRQQHQRDPGAAPHTPPANLAVSARKREAPLARPGNGRFGYCVLTTHLTRLRSIGAELLDRLARGFGKIAKVEISGRLAAHVRLGEAEFRALFRNIDRILDIDPITPSRMLHSLVQDGRATSRILRHERNCLVWIFAVEIHRLDIGFQERHRQLAILEEVGIRGKKLVPRAEFLGRADIAAWRIISVAFDHRPIDNWRPQYETVEVAIFERLQLGRPGWRGVDEVYFR